MIKIILRLMTFISTVIFAVPVPGKYITQASGSSINNISTSGGSAIINSSFGSSAERETTTNYGNTVGIANGPNASFGASNFISSGTSNAFSNSFSSGSNSINGAAGSTGGSIGVGSTFSTTSNNGNAYLMPGSYGSGSTYGTTYGNAAFGSAANFQAVQNSILNSSGVSASGTSFGSSSAPYSGTNGGSYINVASNPMGSYGTNNNFISTYGNGLAGSGSNFNSYNIKNGFY